MDTPAVVINKKRMMKNILDMAQLAQTNGVELRPHIKTHKTPTIAKEQLKAGATGITVATVSEAEVMAENHIHNIFIAYPIISKKKIKRVMMLNQNIKLIVGVDSIEGAIALNEQAKINKQTLDVRLEIDTGLKRTGVKYQDAINLGKDIGNLSHLNLTGIYSYKGAVLKGKTTLNLKQAGREEGKLLVSVAKQLRQNGLNIKDVSAGSTPTSKYVSQVEGITEIRPGTYVFNDRMQKEFGICEKDDCAAKVVSTIVSIPNKDLLVIDGGSKAFATDVVPNTPPLHLKGYGLILDHQEAVLERLTEEHGMVKIPENHSFKIGDQLNIIPNHICSTVNLYNDVYMLEDDHSLNKITVKARGMVT